MLTERQSNFAIVIALLAFSEFGVKDEEELGSWLRAIVDEQENIFVREGELSATA